MSSLSASAAPVGRTSRVCRLLASGLFAGAFTLAAVFDAGMAPQEALALKRVEKTELACGSGIVAIENTQAGGSATVGCGESATDLMEYSFINGQP